MKKTVINIVYIVISKITNYFDFLILKNYKKLEKN